MEIKPLSAYLIILILALFTGCSEGENGESKNILDSTTADTLAQSEEESPDEIPGLVRKKIVAPTDYEPGNSCVYELTYYNSGGQKIEYYEYEDCRDEDLSVKYSYDDSNRIFISTMSLNDKKMVYDWKYENGKLMEIVSRKKDRDFPARIEVITDEEGNVVDRFYFNTSGGAFKRISRIQYVYEDGRKVRTVFFADGDMQNPVKEYLHSYNDSDQEIKRTVQSGEALSETEERGVFYEYYPSP